MAKKTKLVNGVSSSSLQSVIDKHSDFGWELFGNPQEVNITTTHRTQETDKHYASAYDTTTKHWNITFQRDEERKNYAELVELERQYDAPLPPAPSTFAIDMPKRMGCLWIILTFIGFCLWFFPGVIILLWRLLSYKKRVAKWEQQKAQFEKDSEPANAAYEEAKKKRAEVRQKAKSLV